MPTWSERAKTLTADLGAVVLALRHPRMPWYAKLLAVAVVAYALSPIDLIPDFVPVLGYLDDLVIVPIGIALVRRTMPADVLADCRARAAAAGDARWLSTMGAAIVVVLWGAMVALAIVGIRRSGAG